MEYLFLRRKKTSGTSVRQKALLYRAAGREWTARFSSLSDVRPADSLIYKGILSRTTSVQFLLNKIHVDGDTCRKSVDNSAYSFSV